MNPKTFNPNDESTLTRYYVAGVPLEEEGFEEWVEAPNAAEAAHMAGILYKPFPWYFSRMEWNNETTGERMSTSLTTDGALADLNEVQ